MKKILITIFFFLAYINSYSQNPAYELDARNFSYFSNKIEWDIYIYHTNGPVAFEYSGGQYYFNFNPLIANGGTLTYSIIGSDLPSPFQPRGPEVFNSQLRLAINTFPGPGFGYNMTNNVYPGTKIVRVRLSTSAPTLANQPLELVWRNPPVPPNSNPVTKIFAYVGTTNTNITTPLKHLMNRMSRPPQLISPLNNSLNNQLTLTFQWRKVINATSYRLQVATDSLFNNIIRNDSVFLDTFKTVTGLNHLTKYYWKVRAMNTSGPTAYSIVWNFTTRDIIKLRLSVLMEGMYSQIFNLMTRRDTVKVLLRNNFSPYAIRDTVRSTVDSITFSGLFKFPIPPAGTYYIVAKHFNCIETWSKASGQALITTDTNTYNFTTAASQAFGNNMKLKGSKYCIISGDVNQDGFIDGSDFIIIENDAFFFRTGRFIPSDLNGDNAVDGTDALIGDNNRSSIVITP